MKPEARFYQRPSGMIYVALRPLVPGADHEITREQALAIDPQLSKLDIAVVNDERKELRREQDQRLHEVAVAAQAAQAGQAGAPAREAWVRWSIERIAIPLIVAALSSYSAIQIAITELAGELKALRAEYGGHERRDDLRDTQSATEIGSLRERMGRIEGSRNNGR